MSRPCAARCVARARTANALSSPIRSNAPGAKHGPERPLLVSGGSWSIQPIARQNAKAKSERAPEAMAPAPVSSRFPQAVLL